MSVCTIIEGAPRVDTKGLSQFSHTVPSSHSTSRASYASPPSIRYLRPSHFSRETPVSCPPHRAFPSYYLVHLFIYLLALFLRSSDHSDDHLNIKWMPFSFLSPTHMMLIGIHLTRFPHNGSLPSLPLPPFHYTDLTPFAAYRLSLNSSTQTLQPPSTSQHSDTSVQWVYLTNLPRSVHEHGGSSSESYHLTKRNGPPRENDFERIISYVHIIPFNP